MKILLISDMHLTDKNPVNRTDDIFKTQKDKVNQIVEIYKREKCKFMLQTGDFFDSWNPSFELLSYYIMLSRKHKIDIYCVAGQHDLYMHSLKNITRTGLMVMEASGISFILGGLNNAANICYMNLNIYGCSYGERIPIPTFKSKGNVLVIHKLISPEKLFPQQELLTPRQFVKDNPGWDLILCGDSHYHFFEKHGRTTILNTGCMIRKTIGERDLELKPSVYIWNTETNKFKRIFLKIKPVEEIFNLKAKKGADKINPHLDKFIRDMKNQKGMDISFDNNLKHYFRANKVSKEVQQIIIERIGK